VLPYEYDITWYMFSNTKQGEHKDIERKCAEKETSNSNGEHSFRPYFDSPHFHHTQAASSDAVFIC